MRKIPFDAKLYTKKIRVDKLKVGDVLADDVYFKSGTLVVGAGVALTKQHIDKLRYLDDKIVTLDMRQVYRRGVQISKKIFRDAADGKHLTVKEVEVFVRPFKEEIEREPNVTRLLYHLQSNDEYTFQHTINIGVLVMIIGKWLGLAGGDLHNLLLAGTLHDIGKCKIPNHILNKPGPLTRDEFNLMKNHTIYGYEILKNSPGFDPAVCLSVLQHHERMGGEGYPYGLKGGKIHQYARIVAVADVYHAMTTTRVYRDKNNPYEVLEHLGKNINSLDTAVTLTFIEKMLSLLQSCKVRLNNGSYADVIYIDKQNISRPVVRTVDSQKMLDLKKRSDIAIVEIIYHDD